MPGRVKRILLVRHGQSLGNVDPNVHQTHADHAIPLSDEGKAQAIRAGGFLRQWFKANVSPLVRPRLWTSPYLRTRQTADGIEEGMGTIWSGPPGRAFPTPQEMMEVPFARDRKENIALCEQQFGLFDGVPDDELPIRFPAEAAHYSKCEEFEGRFWARMPLGESRFDVAMRVHQAFGTWQRDAEKYGIDHLIVVGHGVTNRAIIMRWLHLPFEWFDQEPNPKNCSVRLIEDNEDKGYVYKGG
jgi:2,3-bisphosphoglycerate-dependent phosphoglycerate mutase